MWTSLSLFLPEARALVCQVTLRLIRLERHAARCDLHNRAHTVGVAAQQLHLDNGMAAGRFDVTEQGRVEIGFVKHSRSKVGGNAPENV